MSSIPEILTAFKDVIADSGIEARLDPDQLIFPGAFPYLEDGPYDGTTSISVVLKAYWGDNGDDAASQLYAWLDEEGPIVAAIDEDPTLGGVVSSTLPFGARNITKVSLASGQRAWSGELVCQVLR